MRWSLPFVPTARAAWISAIAAPIALVIGAVNPAAWVIAPAAAAVLLALIVLDGLLAGKIANWDVVIPQDAEVGELTQLGVEAKFASSPAGKVEASLQFDPRLSSGGRGDITLSLGREPGLLRGSTDAVPNRRGTATINRAWLRWTGPLGLGAKQQNRALEESLRIWPDLSPVRAPELQMFLRDAQLGLLARRIRGEGTQFEALSEYEAGMDRRRIDWKASARHTKLYARENESERNNQIVLAFDCGQSMCEPVDGLPRIDRAVSAGLTCAYVALKGNDKVSLFGFAERPEVITPFVSDVRAFNRLQSAAAGLDYHNAEANFTLALATLSSKLKRRSLVVLFSDFADPTAAQLMVESIGRLVKKHLVLFVTIADSELEELVSEDPDDLATLARSVTADTLVTQRATVLEQLRQLGVDVVEAPWEEIGYSLIDRYFDIRRHEAIG